MKNDKNIDKGIIDCSVLIPVYNSENTINELYQRLEKVFKKINKNFEVIFVNDYSTDESFTVLKKLYSTKENIIVIDLYSNYGQQNALMCGFRYCNGRYIITMDDDLQQFPEDIPKLIDSIKQGYDLIIASYTNKKTKLYRRFGSLLYKKLVHNIFSLSKDINFSSFRIIKSHVVDQIKDYTTTYPYVTGLLLQITKNIDNVLLDYKERKFGKSNYNFRKLIELSFNLLVNYSTIPLRFFSYIGLTVSILSVSLGLGYMIKQLLSNQAPPGWTSLIVLMSFYNALILILFFVLGIYISRLLKESASQKQYSVRRVLK